jgi:DNA-binding XRE family transcriptional regulator
MTRVQFIIAPDGQELAVLPRAEYERLAAAAGEEAAEDAATARLVDRALGAIERGEELVLPAEVSDRLAAGENPIRVLRQWRDAGPNGMSQLELAAAAGTTQSYISDLERGKKRGNPELLKKIARALGVPLDLLVADPD